MKTTPIYSAAPGDARPIARQFMADSLRLSRQNGTAPRYSRATRSVDYGNGVSVTFSTAPSARTLLSDIAKEEEIIRQAKTRLKNLHSSLVDIYEPHKAGEIIETRRGKISVSYTKVTEGLDGKPLWEIHGFQMLKNGKSGTRKDSVFKPIF